jgi:hypothetical protein
MPGALVEEWVATVTPDTNLLAITGAFGGHDVGAAEIQVALQ